LGSKVVAGSVRIEALHRAAALVGGKEQLCELLEVSVPQLEAWLEASETPPIDVFLKTVDLIASPLPPGPQRFLLRRFQPGDVLTMASAAVEAAIGGTYAQRGNLQVRRADGLHILAHKGFAPPFLEFFACVHDEDCACGAALKRGERVVIPDVASHSLFAGKPAGGILAEAGVRAVQCTPLLTTSGDLLGMLNTHYDKVCQPTERELEIIDRIARRAAFWLESGTV
jgi:hypothetical protein